jgi:hypothetical protein
MLNLKTLLNKSEFTKLNGEIVVDLIRRAVSFLGIKSNSGINYQVTEETAMRSDLISNYYYQDSSFCDILLKYNGYSNPFAIDVNDIIKIPETSTLSNFGKGGTALEIGKPRKKKATSVFQPTTKKDKSRINFLIKKAGVGAAPIPPNIAITNGVTISNGKIIFGADVTNIKKEDCPEPISRTKLKESLLKNKINN